MTTTERCPVHDTSECSPHYNGCARLLRGIPIREYMPDDLGEAAYASIARVYDEINAERARRELEAAENVNEP